MFTRLLCLHNKYGSMLIKFLNFCGFYFQVPVFCGLYTMEKAASRTSHFLGRSGKHLFLTDKDDGKPPLLLQMANDCEDLKFMWVLLQHECLLSAQMISTSHPMSSCLCRSALQSFKRRVAYANVRFDRILLFFIKSFVLLWTPHCLSTSIVSQISICSDLKFKELGHGSDH